MDKSDFCCYSVLISSYSAYKTNYLAWVNFYCKFGNSFVYTAQKNKFSIKDLFCKCDQSTVSCGFGHFYGRNPWSKTSFSVKCSFFLKRNVLCIFLHGSHHMRPYFCDHIFAYSHFPRVDQDDTWNMHGGMVSVNCERPINCKQIKKRYFCSTYCTVCHCSLYSYQSELHHFIQIFSLSDLCSLTASQCHYPCYYYRVRVLGLFWLGSGVEMAIALLVLSVAVVVIGCSGSSVAATVARIMWI